MTDRQEMLREKLAADTPGESPAELRERADNARQEAKDANLLYVHIRASRYTAISLLAAQAEPVDQSWWEDAIKTLDGVAEDMKCYAIDCRERADELDEQAEEASLSPSSRGLLHCEGQ